MQTAPGQPRNYFKTDSKTDSNMSPILKYIIRAIKYFFYFSLLLIVLLTILVLAHIVDGNIETMFRDGYKSLIQIGIMFGCVSAIYPVFGFVRKDAVIPGEHSDIRGGIIDFMESRGYKLESEDGENMTFRSRSLFHRFSRMLEDRITLTRNLGGYQVEGLRKDVVRLIYGLESKFRES